MSKKFIIEYASGKTPEIPGYILEGREYIASTGIHHKGYMIEIDTLEQLLDVWNLMNIEIIISKGTFSSTRRDLKDKNIVAVLTGYDDYIE